MLCLTYEADGPAFSRTPPRSDVTAQRPTLWKWEISEHGMEIMSGFETSRETAQIQGDSALFMLLSERLS